MTLLYEGQKTTSFMQLFERVHLRYAIPHQPDQSEQ